MAKRQLAQINPAMLVWARESLQLAVAEAALRIGVQEVQLAEWEAGRSMPTIPQLRTISTVYRRPLAAFFLAEAPRDFHIPHDFRQLPGPLPARMSPSLILELRLADTRRQIAVDLAEDDDVVALLKPMLGSVSVSDDASDRAQSARSLLGVPLAEQYAWTDEYAALRGWIAAFERLGALVFQFGDVEVSEVRGFSISQFPFPVVAVNGKDSANGRIFSLMHELAHLLLGRGGSCDLAERGPMGSADRRIETFCNRFAGELLVPLDELSGDPAVRKAQRETQWTDAQVGQMANRFRVSREVILRRLLTLSKTNEAYYLKKRDEFQRAAETARETSKGFLPVPNRAVRAAGASFSRIVLSAYYREEITSRDVAEYLGVRLKHLSAIEELVASGGPPVGASQ